MKASMVFAVIGALVVFQLSLVHGAAVLKEQGTNTFWPFNPLASFQSGEWKVPKVKIPYKKGNLYGDDFSFLRSAMKQITDVTKNCISFDSFIAEDHFIDFKIPEDVDPFACASNLGKMTAPRTSGQAVYAFKDSFKKGECLTNKRDTLRLLMNILGVGNEYQRTDQNKAMIFANDYENLLPKELRGKNFLQIKTNLMNNSPFDVDSITMVSGDRFADNVSFPLFKLKGGKVVPTEEKLSRYDCQALDYIYECDLLEHCKDPSVFIQPSTAPTVPPPSLCQIETRTIDANLNCWPAGQEAEVLTQAELDNKLGLLRILQPFSNIKCASTVVPASLDVTGRVLGDGIQSKYDNALKELSIYVTNKISKGFSSIIQIFGVDEDENLVLTSDVIIVNVNCLPTFSTPCVQGACPVNMSLISGTRETNQEVPLVKLNLAQCELGSALPAIQLGPFQATDPDGNLPGFLSLDVTATENGVAVPENSWQWQSLPDSTSLSGNAIWSLRPLKVPVSLNVTWSVIDAQYLGAASITAGYEIGCSPTRKPGLTLPPIPDL